MPDNTVEIIVKAATDKARAEIAKFTTGFGTAFKGATFATKELHTHLQNVEKSKIKIFILIRID